MSRKGYELPPCPFCGEDGYGVHLQKCEYPNEDYNRWAVICECCGASIGECVTPERAVEAWSRRAGQCPAPTEEGEGE